MLEKIVSGVLVVISLVYMFAAKDLAFGSFGQPGVGFMPIIVGYMGSGLSIINFISVMMKKPKNGEESDPLAQFDLVKLVKFVIGCAAYVLLLKYTGFLIATFLVLTYLLKVTEVKGWVLPVIISAGTSVGFYVVFQKMLGVLLP